ncbi:hypothetical protein CLOSTHATH_03608 [Hungatella hathewayi DSM 13479]|uniref:Uncharacterized protein n=1 Tax=Hungatella hathewayi DSM 13479 TaxID=566550 RepID=D3AJ18_9FIRM|nr:hypothetical protein CLOSTHATH_03608 [Hungatella hathewayi DSM 13479]
MLSVSAGAGESGAFLRLPAAAKTATAMMTTAAMIPAAQYFIFLFIIPFPPFLIGIFSMRWRGYVYAPWKILILYRISDSGKMRIKRRSFLCGQNRKCFQ